MSETLEPLRQVWPNVRKPLSRLWDETDIPSLPLDTQDMDPEDWETHEFLVHPLLVDEIDLIISSPNLVGRKIDLTLLHDYMTTMFECDHEMVWRALETVCDDNPEICLCPDYSWISRPRFSPHE